jgi:hypothetical protein
VSSAKDHVISGGPPGAPKLAATTTFNMGQRPESVAQATLDALGRWMTVGPGWLSKLLEWSLKPLPRSGRVRMMGVIMRGMAQKHD